MECNVGKTDRIIRIVIGVLLLVLAINLKSILWGILGAIVLATGIFRFCGLYKLLGVDTGCKR